MAVLTAIVTGFLFLPVLWNKSMLKKYIIASSGAIGMFLGLEIYAERISARLDAIYLVMTSRMWRPTEEITAIVSEMSIPLSVRVHYYIFSIIFILAVLNFLYNLANILYGDGKPGKRIIILHGIAAACYGLSYFFVRVMQFDNLAAMQLTGWSVFNAAVCFILAAITVGLYCGSFLQFEGLKKFMPSILSMITIATLYAAQYIMLEGNFYSYHDNIVITALLRILIIVSPGVVVYSLNSKCEKYRCK